MVDRPPGESHSREYLANERTFLAWIRTSVSLVGLGLVVAKFSYYVRELLGSRARGLGLTAPLGEVMMAMGALLALLAAWRYYVVNKAIDRGKVEPDHGLVNAVTALVVLFAAAAVILSLVGWQR
ncbi:MAG TPA: DUF202 domain-containing protein [Candidatus Nitrosotenuis sp.]|jgi:putative membrane protein|nr:DUF202 domain-containing protein [Candidatus Nitrosotenuis sp.]